MERSQTQPDGGDDYNDGDYEMFTNVQSGEHNDEEIPQVDAVHMGVAPKSPFRLIIAGGSGSGKTTVASHMLKKMYPEYYDEVHMFSPTAKWDPAWKDVKFTKVHESLDQGELEAIYEKAEARCKGLQDSGMAKSKRILIIFDDCIAESKFMNSPELLKMNVQGRHCNISNMMLTQSYMKVPRSVRLQATDIIFFPSNLSEVDRVSKEHCPPNTSSNDFRKLVLHATKEKHHFLFMCKRKEVPERFRRNFDTMLALPSFVDERDIRQSGEEESSQRQMQQQQEYSSSSF